MQLRKKNLTTLHFVLRLWEERIQVYLDPDVYYVPFFCIHKEVKYK